MTRHKVDEIDGAKLDAAVAMAEGYSSVRIREAEDRSVCQVEMALGGGRFEWVAHSPSRNWSEGGPIIEREGIAIERVAYSDGSLREWCAAVAVGGEYPEEWRWWHGATPLIAAMRAYVASKFGETVEML